MKSTNKLDRLKDDLQKVEEELEKKAYEIEALEEYYAKLSARSLEIRRTMAAARSFNNSEE